MAAPVAAAYRDDDLMPPGLTPTMLCRYEHGQEEPGDEYWLMISRAYNPGGVPAAKAVGTTVGEAPAGDRSGRGRSTNSASVAGW